LVYEEGKRQENIESITNKAIPHLKDSAKPEEIEVDWLSNFFDKSRLISDQEMQELWAKMLAQEGNSPQSVTKRTIALLASMDKKDAELFTKFCSFVWNFGGLIPLVYNDDAGPTFDAGLNFNQLTHLDSIGLINFGSVSGFQLRKLPKYMLAHYYGRAVTIEFPADKNDLSIGKVLLTDVGKQLAAVCSPRPSEEHYLSVIKQFIDSGYTVSSRVDGRGF
jgi:hypothetical protein